MIYEYYYGRKFPQSWGANIGDYIQSLAALQYLPKNCKPYLIDRDELQFYNGTKIKFDLSPQITRAIIAKETPTSLYIRLLFL